MRVVVKIGSSSLTDEHGRLRTDVVSSIVEQIATARLNGHEVVLVTSGAVAAGVGGMGLAERPTDIGRLQALSAVGQPLLMAAYNDNLSRHGLTGAQVLLVPHDFVDRTQYLHARDTMTQLMTLGCVPIVNENDAIANTEIRYGDNDHLSALVSHLVNADMLLLLTDTDGLYTSDPRVDSSARRIAVVRADDPLLSVNASGTGSNRGSGGMASKLAAARIASWSGVTAVIAAAATPSIINSVVDGSDELGTRFLPHDRQLSARKLWIAFAADVLGAVTVDDGARAALIQRGTSLLPAGVVGVSGTFSEGDVVEVVATDGTVIARGLSAMSSATVEATRGMRSADIAGGTTEVVHRDDLVLLNDN